MYVHQHTQCTTLRASQPTSVVLHQHTQCIYTYNVQVPPREAGAENRCGQGRGALLSVKSAVLVKLVTFKLSSVGSVRQRALVVKSAVRVLFRALCTYIYMLYLHAHVNVTRLNPKT
jgi:hypothetical protein